MPSHSEIRILPYNREQVFNIVANVEEYPDFLPWCLSCEKTLVYDNGFEANLEIGFNFLNENFISRVEILETRKINVEYKEGPFSYLRNEWKFDSLSDGSGTKISFFLEFEFKSILLRTLMGAFFEEAVRTMVSAFEQRAIQLYGEKN